jgi:putative ABC transport system substrate-binding protein
MTRRELIALLGGSAAAWSFSSRAQGAVRRIGCLVTGSRESHGQFVAAFRQRLRELGHFEPQDFILELRWADGQLDRLPALADELALLAPDLIVTATTGAALAAKRAMPAIPIISATLIDPIGAGLVTSHARPGGNVTGTLISFETLLGKQLELAREVIPGASRIGMLLNPNNPVNAFQRKHAEATAAAMGVRLVPVETRSPEDLDAAFETFAREHSEIVLVLLDAMFITERRRIAALALAARMATMAGERDMVEVGGLVSYGIDLSDNWRRAAYFVDRILRGAKPADLPVEMPVKYAFVINLKAAAALDVTVPAPLLARADEIIE